MGVDEPEDNPLMIIYNQRSSQLDDEYWKNHAAWKLKFAFLPQRCLESKELIWLRYAYRGEYTLRGPGEPIRVRMWLTTVEYLMWRLRNSSFN